MLDTPPDLGIVGRSINSLRLAVRRTFRAPRAAFQEPLLPANRSFWLIFAGVLAAIAACIIWLDAPFYEFQNARRSDFGFEINFYRRVTRLGESRWVLLATLFAGLFLSTLVWTRYSRKRRLQLISIYSDINFLFFTTAIAGITTFLLKNMIVRARPKMYSEFGVLHFEPLTFDYDLASFPSGHSTTFGATCMVLTLLFPRFWPLWLVVAVVGGITRIMMLSHHPSDMLAGLSFGALFVILSARWLAQRGTMFKFNGSVLPVRKR